MPKRKLPSLGETTPLVPPLYQSSVYTLPDLDTLDRIMDDQEPGFIYARDAHPNARHLAGLLAQLESAAWGVVCGSGMAAISAILLSTVAARAANRGQQSPLWTHDAAIQSGAESIRRGHGIRRHLRSGPG